MNNENQFEFHPTEKDSEAKRFHILLDDELDDLFETEDSSTTLDDIASMKFDDYEVVPEKEVSSTPVRVSTQRKIVFRDLVETIICFLFILFLLVLSIHIFLNSFSDSSKTIVYSEDSDIQYQVYLKDNDVYQQEFLGENMTYIPSLIQLIKIKMNYQFQLNLETDYQYQYRIYANLKIVDKKDPNKVYYDENDSLVDGVMGMMGDDKKITIHEDVSIDYAYYNDISNRFRSSYGLDTNNTLTVYLSIHGSCQKPISLSSTSSPSIHIPLSNDSVQFSIENVHNHQKIIPDKYYPFKSIVGFFIGFVFCFLSMFTLILFGIYVYRMNLKK